MTTFVNTVDLALSPPTPSFGRAILLPSMFIQLIEGGDQAGSYDKTILNADHNTHTIS